MSLWRVGELTGGPQTRVDLVNRVSTVFSSVMSQLNQHVGPEHTEFSLNQQFGWKWFWEMGSHVTFLAAVKHTL